MGHLRRLLAAAIASVSLLVVGGAPARADAGDDPAAVTVAADRGWQPTAWDLRAGQSFTVAYRAGSWTVGSPGLALVGMRGYDDAADEEIYQGCKVLADRTYGHLLARTGQSPPFVVDRSGTFTASAAGRLEFRINDDDRCLGDNAGALTLGVGVTAGGEDPAGVLGPLCPDLDTSEGSWHCKTLLVAIFNSPPCVVRLLAATVITYADYFAALGSPPCLAVFGPALAQLTALGECYQVHHDIGVCLGMRSQWWARAVAVSTPASRASTIS